MVSALYSRVCFVMLALLCSSCITPSSSTSSGGGSATCGNFLVFGKWKLVKGYPANWGFGGSNPSSAELANDFRIMIIERGEDMCTVNVINQAVQSPPVFRMKYIHKLEDKIMQISVFWNGNNLTSWQKETVTYSLTGCSSDKPQLTLSYLNGYKEIYEVYSREVGGGDCGNPTNPEGS